MNQIQFDIVPVILTLVNQLLLNPSLLLPDEFARVFAHPCPPSVHHNRTSREDVKQISPPSRLPAQTIARPVRERVTRSDSFVNQRSIRKQQTEVSSLSLWIVQRNVTSPAGRGTWKNYARKRKEVIIFTPLKHSRRKAKEEKLNHVRTGAEKFSPPIVVICPAPVNNTEIARLSPRGGQRKGCWPKSASESS